MSSVRIRVDIIHIVRVPNQVSKDLVCLSFESRVTAGICENAWTKNIVADVVSD